MVLLIIIALVMLAIAVYSSNTFWRGPFSNEKMNEDYRLYVKKRIYKIVLLAQWLFIIAGIFFFVYEDLYGKQELFTIGGTIGIILYTIGLIGNLIGYQLFALLETLKKIE